jgi:fluoride exporter
MASTVEIEPGKVMEPEHTDTGELARSGGRRGRGRFGDPYLLVAIFIGGAIGALLRAALTRYIPTAPNGFPWTVLLINVGGAIVLTYVAIRLQERLPPSTYRRPLVGTGFCGALTTFSTLQVGVVKLGRDGHVALGAGYLAVSVCLGVVAAVLTTAATRRAQLR